MFLHESYQHLAENMLALLLNGRSVWEQFGTGGLLTMYFTGGALAALDRCACSMQHEAVSRAMSCHTAQLLYCLVVTVYLRPIACT
jgi:membrane associated rhomboid family serine protease